MKIMFLASASTSTNSYPHLGMAILASILKRHGHMVCCIDGSAPYRAKNNESLVEECQKWKPDVVCITATTERIKFAYHLLALLRSRFGEALPIISGGPHASIRPIEMVGIGFDIAVVGAAENRIARIIVAAAERDEPTLLRIPGVAFKSVDGGVKYSGTPAPEDLPCDLSALLPIDFSAFNERDYSRNASENWCFGSIFAGRGCPGCCIYCDRSVFGSKLHIASSESIIADMVNRRTRYGVSRFYFLDDTLLWNKKALLEICNNIIDTKELTGCTWGCNARPNLTDDALLSTMKKSGCTSVTLGIESGCEETLQQIKKNIKKSAMVASIDAIIRNGMQVTVNLMFGFPWDNRTTAKKHLEFCRSLMRPGISSFSAGSTVFPYPGTEIYETNKDKGYPLNNWWLRDDFFEKNNAATLYRKGRVVPYFRRLVPRSPTVNPAEDFFYTYKDLQVKKTIEVALQEMHTWNQAHCNGKFLRFRFLRMTIAIIGSILFALSPQFERFFWHLLLRRKSA